MMGLTRSAAPSTQGPSSGLGACAVMLINVRVEKQRGGVPMCVSRRTVTVGWRGPARRGPGGGRALGPSCYIAAPRSSMARGRMPHTPGPARP